MPDGPETELSPADKRKADWIQDIVGGEDATEKSQLELSADNLAMMDHRKAGQAAIRGLDAQKEGIREALMSIEVKVKKESVGSSSKMKLLDGEGDYRNEIDTVHHAKLMKEALSVEQQNLVQAQFDKVLSVREELRGNPYYDPGQPPEFIEPEPPVYTDDMEPTQRAKADEDYRAAVKLLEKKEAEWAAKVAECERHLTEDLWTPLVREGVLPENFILQKNSEVSSLFEHAATAYDERLEEYSAEMTEADILAEKFALGYKIGKGVLKVAATTTGAVGAVGELFESDPVAAGTEIADEVFEYLDVALTLAETITPLIIKEKDFASVGLAIAQSVASVLSSATDSEVANIVTRVIQNGARGVSIGQHLNKTPPDYEAAFGEIVESITNELSDNDPQEGGGLMTSLAANMQTAASTLFASKGIAAMVRNGAPPAAILSALMDVATSLGAKAAGAADDEDEEESDFDLEALTFDISDGLKAIYKEKITEEVLQQREAETDAAAAALVLKAAEEAAEEERAQMAFHLSMGFPLASDDTEAAQIAEFQRVNSIEYLIRMQKKNEATFKLCEQIATKGMMFVVKLFPPAALAQAALTLGLAIKNAVEQTQEMILWRENVEDAMSAVSPQVDAMLNRSGLQTRQAMQAYIQTALEASRVVAQALALSPLAPAAPVIEKVADATEAAIELADLIYTEVQLAAAWKVYQKAREVPEDRWLARKAMRENPTLSKYAMAYGALNGDPIAIEGLRRCGLNKQVMANPDTNVSKVVSFLEAKYADDPVLLRAVPAKEDWHPGPVELSGISWMKFYNLAIKPTKKGGAGVQSGGDISGIAAALGRMEVAEKAFDAALDEVATRAADTTKSEHKLNAVVMNTVAKDSLSIALIELRSKLDGYKPIDATTSKPHDEMAKYLDALRALSEQRSAAINKIERDAPWLSKLKDDPPEPARAA